MVFKDEFELETFKQVFAASLFATDVTDCPINDRAMDTTISSSSPRTVMKPWFCSNTFNQIASILALAMPKLLNLDKIFKEWPIYVGIVKESEHYLGGLAKYWSDPTLSQRIPAITATG